MAPSNSCLIFSSRKVSNSEVTKILLLKKRYLCIQLLYYLSSESDYNQPVCPGVSSWPTLVVISILTAIPSFLSYIVSGCKNAIMREKWIKYIIEIWENCVLSFKIWSKISTSCPISGTGFINWEAWINLGARGDGIPKFKSIRILKDNLNLVPKNPLPKRRQAKYNKRIPNL